MGSHRHHDSDSYSSEDSRREDDSSGTSSEEEESSSDSEDDRELLRKEEKHHHSRGGKENRHRSHEKHRHAAAPAHSHSEMTTTAFIVAAIGAVILVGGYWLYTKNGSSLFPSSGSASSTGSAGAGSGSGSDTSSKATATGSSTGGGGASASSTATKTEGGSSDSSSSGNASSTSTGATPSSSSEGSGGGGGGKVLSFFENWKGVDPASVDFTGLYVAFWFCSVPDASGAVDLHESVAGQAKTFAEAATKAGTKPILTVGGWDGSAPFSKLVASEDTRKPFVETMVKLMEDNSYEGIDIDWEYPGKAGATEDFDVKNDLANLLLLLQEIREKIGDDKILSADTSSGVYNEADGNPSTDMSEFGKVLDFITIMTYDATTYSSKTTGPNFAFSSKCAPSTGTYEIPTAVQAWIDAKFPAEKISVGLASYGYAWEVADFKDGGGVDGASSSIYQTSSKVFSAADGFVPFNKIESDYLGKMDYTFDECTSTPFLYSKDTKLFIAYDDEKSFAVKGGVVKEKGLMGCSVYAGLTQDSDGKLTKAAIDAC
ncbi:glycoside hydrolase family 18 protein [Sporobolomyces salmoneus]|uniref:glycoside hydrolase family 18 protein n=1 Tax=Sporobolomyces salmoneus TaxID=183962 RepID=UPI00316D23AB